MLEVLCRLWLVQAVLCCAGAGSGSGAGSGAGLTKDAYGSGSPYKAVQGALRLTPSVGTPSIRNRQEGALQLVLEGAVLELVLGVSGFWLACARRSLPVRRQLFPHGPPRLELLPDKPRGRAWMLLLLLLS